MTTMMMLTVVFAVLLFALVALVIYRNTLEMHEDDQLFLSVGESHMAKEQEELQVKLNKVEPMVRWVGAASALVLLAMGGLWIHEAMTRTLP